MQQQRRKHHQQMEEKKSTNDANDIVDDDGLNEQIAAEISALGSPPLIPPKKGTRESCSRPPEFPGALVVPICTPPPIGPIDGALALPASLADCYEEALESLHLQFGVEHLSVCTDPKLFEYPIAGIVHGSGVGNRHVIPMKVRAFPKSKAYIVFFVVDSGAPITSLTKKTMQELSGRDDLGEIMIQDIKVRCRLSSSCGESFTNVNLLGSQFIFNSRIATIFSPHEFDDSGDKKCVFYMAPFSLVNQAVAMAACHDQNPNIRKKPQILHVNKHKFSISYPTPYSGEEKIIEEKCYKQMGLKAIPPRSPESRASSTNSQILSADQSGEQGKKRTANDGGKEDENGGPSNKKPNNEETEK